MRELLFVPVVEYFEISLREIADWVFMIVQNHDIELYQPSGSANCGDALVLCLCRDRENNE